MLRSYVALVFASLLFVTLSAGSAAAVTGLPDILSQGITVDYDAAANTLTADGFSTNITFDGVTTQALDTQGVFDLDVTAFDALGAVSGTINITGVSGAFGSPLIFGNVTSVSNSGSATLTFGFDATGGSLQSEFAAGGKIKLAQTGFTGSFASNFSGPTSQSTANTAPVPEPSGLALALLGWGAVSWRVRSGRRS